MYRCWLVGLLVCLFVLDTGLGNCGIVLVTFLSSNCILLSKKTTRVAIFSGACDEAIVIINRYSCVAYFTVWIVFWVVYDYTLLVFRILVNKRENRWTKRCLCVLLLLLLQ